LPSGKASAARPTRTLIASMRASSEVGSSSTVGASDGFVDSVIERKSGHGMLVGQAESNYYIAVLFQRRRAASNSVIW
jgi:hypothetical protein